MNEYLPGLEGVPATKSNISFIDGERGVLAYRGYAIEDLATHSTFEETTLLLLDGHLPNASEVAAFDSQLRAHRRIKYTIRDLMKCLPSSGHPMDILQTMMASLGMFHPPPPKGTYTDWGYAHAVSIEILARVPVLVAMWEHIRHGYDPVAARPDLRYAENFLYMMTGQEPEPLLARIMDTCLILHAEHTINASTFSALVTASTLASPTGVIAAAISTLAGPLHGGANQKVVEMLAEIGRPQHVKTWLDGQLAKKTKIWGLGHREYKIKDPRAVILQKLVEQLIAQRGGHMSPMFETALALEEAAAERLAHKGVYPNVDFYSGILYSEMGIPADQFTSVFAIARCAGWLAHWREQLSNNRIFRPTQVYTGEALRPFIPLAQRME